jgi:hypothetical protein
VEVVIEEWIETAEELGQNIGTLVIQKSDELHRLDVGEMGPPSSPGPGLREVFEGKQVAGHRGPSQLDVLLRVQLVGQEASQSLIEPAGRTSIAPGLPQKNVYSFVGEHPRGTPGPAATGAGMKINLPSVGPGGPRRPDRRWRRLNRGEGRAVRGQNDVDSLGHGQSRLIGEPGNDPWALLC